MNIVFVYRFVLQGLMLGPSHFLQLTRETVGHQCSLQAEAIRAEVETMRVDFNFRLRQVLFNSTVVVYHGTILPCYFAQVSLSEKNVS